MALSGFRRRHRHERTGFVLYAAAVQAARDPWFYRTLGVPDTLDGRFDLVCLHAYLLISRLAAQPSPGPALAQAVFDAMFSDMDVNLREMGVGDLSVGRRVRTMWEAFHGRAAAYGGAMSDPVALTAAIARNVWRGARPPAGSAAALARLLRAQDAHLAAQIAGNWERVMAGEAGFLAAQEASKPDPAAQSDSS
ncbi:MAG: ubiquinol-cytochrome C chaperone family protein [Acetobacteraceae bacterium]|nr:ubiquinol-cytochrome C chaperone family protein [Acetobacteraceae bacterium]